MMVDDYIRETISAYDANPGQYEKVTKDIVAHQELKEFLDKLSDKDLPVLDAGCAFGRDSEFFHSSGRRVVGIDLSDGLLERARELNPGIDFIKMDVRELDFPDESFAGIWCNAVLLHLKDEDTVKALSEFARVLAPGGILFVTFKKGIGEEVKGSQFTLDGARYYKYQTIGSAEKLIKDSGLVIDRIYEVNELERWGIERAQDLVHCFAIKK